MASVEFVMADVLSFHSFKICIHSVMCYLCCHAEKQVDKKKYMRKLYPWLLGMILGIMPCIVSASENDSIKVESLLQKLPGCRPIVVGYCFCPKSIRGSIRSEYIGWDR